jgi:hypothetical protein
VTRKRVLEFAVEEFAKGAVRVISDRYLVSAEGERAHVKGTSL